MNKSGSVNVGLSPDDGYSGYTGPETNMGYSGTPLVRPPLLHQKSGLLRGVAFHQE